MKKNKERRHIDKGRWREWEFEIKSSEKEKNRY